MKKHSHNSGIFSRKFFSFMFFMMIIMACLLARASHAQSHNYHQNRQIKKACKIFEKRRYKEFRKELTAMNRRPKKRAEVDVPKTWLANNQKARRVKYNDITYASLYRKPKGTKD